jgi:hypothetical protein
MLYFLASVVNREYQEHLIIQFYVYFETLHHLPSACRLKVINIKKVLMNKYIPEEVPRRII